MKSFRKCFSEARAAPGGPEIGNLAFRGARHKKGGAVAVKELVVGRAWYQNEKVRIPYGVSCLA